MASGAETGWDYSSRWTRNPYAGNATDQNPVLRTLNVRNTTAVDLNSILYKAHIDLATLYDMSAGSLAKRVLRRAPSDSAAHHRSVAATLRTAILDLFWDADRLAFYDFNRTSNARNQHLTAAHWYPLWAGIIPDIVKTNATAAFGTYSSLNLVMRKYNGTLPATYITTGLQWGMLVFLTTYIHINVIHRFPECLATTYLLCSRGARQRPSKRIFRCDPIRTGQQFVESPPQ